MDMVAGRPDPRFECRIKFTRIAQDLQTPGGRSRQMVDPRQQLQVLVVTARR